MARTIQWRLHCATAPDQLFDFLTTGAGRERFWAERSAADGHEFLLTFPDGTQERCSVIEEIRPKHFAFSYFGSYVEIALRPDGQGGTDLTLTNTGVPDEDYHEVHAGWINVLLPLKAAADFGVDLRDHDPKRTWGEGYVDQ